MSDQERLNLIRQSAADAYLLITEIAKSGKTFDVAKIEPILEAMKLDDAALEKFDEAQFWTAVSYISDVAKPLRADTIRRLAQLRSPLQFSTMNLYVWLIAAASIAVLITTLIFLNTASDLQDKLTRLDKIRQDVINAQGATVANPADEAKNKQILNIARLDSQVIHYSLYEKDRGKYNRIAETIAPDSKADMYLAVITNDQLQSYIRASSKDWLQAGQFYWLPVLLAILGSMVAILRSIYMSIEDATVDMLSLTMVTLRVTTGAIAGIAIGWIYKSGGADSIVAVTPFVLAFVAGYAVDLLFTLLDRITKALSDTPTRTPPTPAPS
jgi:hypothetical protein